MTEVEPGGAANEECDAGSAASEGGTGFVSLATLEQAVLALILANRTDLPVIGPAGRLRLRSILAYRSSS